MARTARSKPRAAMALAWAVIAALGAAPWPAGAADSDPLAAEIARLQAGIRAIDPADEEARQVGEGALPLLVAAEQALAEGRRWFAWSRLAFAWTNLEAVAYSAGVPGDLRQQMTALEREWAARGAELAAARRPEGRPRFEGVPAAARAVGEAALSELEGYYEASLDYGRNTAPEYGLFYLGAARAQLALARLAASLREETAASPIAPRDLRFDIAALEDELLEAYRPPASIEQHAVFIRISATLKQAEEMNAAGLRFGAMYRLLDAKMRLARLLRPSRVLDAEETLRRARAARARLAAAGADSSLPRMFIEIAEVMVANPDPALLGGATAAAVFEDVVPLYDSLLGPAPRAPAEQVAEVTVTLLRWPYT